MKLRDDDPLRPAYGCLIGLAISSLFWIVLIVAICLVGC